MRLRGIRRTFRGEYPRQVKLTLPYYRSRPRHFAMRQFTRLLMRSRDHAGTTSTMVNRLLTIVVRARPRPINNYRRDLKGDVTTCSLNTRLSTDDRQDKGTILFNGRRNFLLRNRTHMRLTRSQRVLTTITRSTPLSNILPVHCSRLAIARASLQLIYRVFIRINNSRFRALTLRAALVRFTKVSRLTTISSRRLMQQISVSRKVNIIFRTRHVSSLVLRVCISTSFEVSTAYYLHFKVIDELKLGIGLCSDH